MKILITGSGGYIADEIAKKLYKKKKFQIYGIGRSFKKSKDLNFYTKVIIGEINLQNLNKLNIRPEIIIICSGSGTANIKKTKQTLNDNVYLNKIIISKFCKKKSDIKIIYISSAAIYMPIKGKLNENSIIAPTSIYGKLKYLSEKKIIKFQKKLNFKLIILRVFSIYGIGLKKQILWDACNKLKNNSTIFKGTGNEKRDFINIKDFLSALNKVMTLNFKKKIEVFNVGSGISFKIKYVVKKLADLNKTKKVSFSNIQKNNSPKFMNCDNHKLKKLGWRPIRKLSVELIKYYKWHQNQKQ